MSSRPDLELALDVRSDESVVVLSNVDAVYDYPDHWQRPRGDLSQVGPSSVVVVDRIDLTRKTLAAIAYQRPRLLALAPQGVEQEKSMRRTLSAAYPWAEVWTISSSFGKLLVTKDAVGPAYDRDLVDQRIA